MDIIEVILDLPEKLKKLSDTLFTFLFSSITIDGNEYSFWLLLGGVGVVAIILYSIIKN